MIRTAECVSPMHPDKMCDRISDTLLDLHLTHDPNSRCAIEICGGNGLVYVTGEVTSEYKVTQQEIEKVVSEIPKMIRLQLSLILTNNHLKLLKVSIQVVQETKGL